MIASPRARGNSSAGRLISSSMVQTLTSAPVERASSSIASAMSWRSRLLMIATRSRSPTFRQARTALRAPAENSFFIPTQDIYRDALNFSAAESYIWPGAASGKPNLGLIRSKPPASDKEPISGGLGQVSFVDKTLTCRDCGKEFTFTAGEQEL